MARKTSKLAKLEEVVRKQADSLDPAQREFVLAEFGMYLWNDARIEKLEKQLEESMESANRDLDAEGKLFRQRHQLVSEQSSLFGHIMKWLKGTAAEESKLDAFLNG